MNRRLLAVSLFGALFALGASQAVAQPKPRKKANSNVNIAPAPASVPLEVEGSINELRGSNLELGLKLKKKDGQGQHDLKVVWVKGNQRTTVWEGKSKFQGGQGFSRSVTVDLARHRVDGGHLEVVAPECGNGPKCMAKLMLDKVDLGIEWTAQRFERRGNDTLWKAQVVALGVGNGRSPACKLELKVDNRKVEDINIPALQVGQRHDVSYRYGRDKRGKTLAAELKCADLSAKNNKKTDRLQ